MFHKRSCCRGVQKQQEKRQEEGARVTLMEEVEGCVCVYKARLVIAI